MDNRHIKALIERLNPVCAKVLEDAAIFAGTRGNYEVRIEHFLIKLLEGETGTDMDYLLKRFDVDLDAFWHKMLESLSRAEAGNQGKPSFSISIFQWLERAWLASTLHYDQGRIRSVALLDALIDLAPVLPVTGLEMLQNISLEHLRSDFRRLVQGSREESSASASVIPQPMVEENRVSGDKHLGHPGLDQFTTNLTERATNGELDPIRGRNGEIRMLIDILCRRRKNNPILVGDPGVGKTALVEGLASRIAEGAVPDHLLNVELRILDLGLLQAGAGVKGEFERRLKQVIDEVKGSPTPVILFIDEAHTLIGAGGDAGVGDAANLIKPALARGELRTLAATTWAEYKKYFERDAALERRFQMVKVDEPTPERAVLMLNGLKSKYEDHHGILITDEAIESAVRLSDRYISDRHLPDKAIDLLDTAAARVRMGHAVAPEAMESLREHIQFVQQRLDNLNREREAGIKVDAAILEGLASEKEQTQSRLDELNARWREEIDKLALPRESLEQMVASNDEAFGQLLNLHREVTPAVIAEVVSEWTGIPAGRMFRSELSTLMTLETRLARRIVGQEMALAQIGESLRNAKAGLRSSDGPLGVFLLAGPSGIGKTETALAIADEIFGGEASLVGINMSEYQESHTVSQLKGSPPGYVGYGEGGVLTEAVRQRPYSAVLLDEVEKAHPDVMNFFYQVFDRGFMRDGEGREIDFRNTVILMTSNLGSEAMLALVESQRVAVEAVLEKSEQEEDLMESLPQPLTLNEIVESIKPALLDRFAPALLGRMQIVPYLPLDLEALQGIVALKLDAIGQRLQQAHGIEFRYLPEVTEQIAGRCINHDAGARFINTLIGQQLMPAISQQLLQVLIDGDKPEFVSLEYDETGELSCLFIDRIEAEATEACKAAI
ncbi:MAG: type VI secretion system ATPase TssH [Candidatus Thiodiazotropha sp. (ex Monitilora ramsayi)]|nr:type VI secretion system ATPase TssH [Candidatus Thiodiazotropha sp. (ex Monitilora ramsayi)]